MVLKLPTPSLVVLVGISGSGKSTWAEGVFATGEIVSSDRLRAMVGAGEDDQTAGTAALTILDQIVEARLTRKVTTVVDTLGFDRDARRRWVALAHAAALPAIAMCFDVAVAKAQARNEQRSRPIPKNVITRQGRRFKEVVHELSEDGFDHIHDFQTAAPVTSKLVAPGPVTPVETSERSHTFGLMISRFNWGLVSLDLGAALASIAVRAEAAGFRDLWMMDHLRQIPQVGRPWEDIPEVWTSLAYVAASTSTLRLGALVSPVTHHHPLVLGKAVATLDVVSGGRANLGLGVGWDREEHRAYGIDFPPTAKRYQMLEDAVRALPMMWGKGSPGFEGETITAPQMACYPRPIQARIPITVGGSGEKKTLRLAAHHADACNLFGRPDKVARKVEVLREHCARLGREPSQVEVTHLVDAMTAIDRPILLDRIESLRPRSTTSDEFADQHNAGTVSDQLTHFQAYHDAGATHSIVVLPDVHIDGSIEDFGHVIEHFAHRP
ncbi:MAG: TIGR03619 family F420-dependent LLM class oxidoreductase [Acidimicrobiia bacterium]